MAHLDRDQAAAYLTAATPAYRPLAELLIACGPRIGEAVALEWPDLDLEALTIRVGRSRKLGGKVGGTKTDRERVVHLDPETAAVLARPRRATDPRSVLVFATASGRMLDPANVRRWHSRTLAAASLPRIRLHDLRHTAATLAGSADESILFVQAQLGHANVRTTMRYVHPDAAAYRAAAARVAAYRRGA
jgi:integrase